MDRFVICFWNEGSPDKDFEEFWPNLDTAKERFAKLVNGGRFGWGGLYDTSVSPHKTILALPDDWDGHT